MAIMGRAIPLKLTELGRIRLGDREPNSKGNGTHPHKLEQFRLTSSNKPLLEYAARHPDIGGEVAEWTDAPGEGRQWELYTLAEALDVVIPTFSAVSLSYERWSTAGCEQRCTGEFITHCGRKPELVGTECACPPDDQERGRLAQEGKACARILRLNVMLPDLPGTGFWRLDTKGFYATAELMGTLQLLKEAGAEHMMIEAVLRLEQRTVKRPRPQGYQGEDKGTLHFVVPVLWPKYTFRQIAAAKDGQQTLLLSEAQKSLPEHIADLYGDVPQGEGNPNQPPALHTAWAQIQRWYEEADRADQFHDFAVWVCKRCKVTRLEDIAETELPDITAKVYATLEPLILARKMAMTTDSTPGETAEGEDVGQASFDYSESASRDRELAED